MKNLILKKIYLLFLSGCLIVGITFFAFNQLNNKIISKNLDILNQGALEVLKNKIQKLPADKRKAFLFTINEYSHQPYLSLQTATQLQSTNFPPNNRNFAVTSDLDRAFIKLDDGNYLTIQYERSTVEKAYYTTYWVRYALLTALSDTPQRDWPKQLKELSKQFGYPLSLMSIRSKELNPDIVKQLHNLKFALYLPNKIDDSIQYFYVAIPNSSLVIQAGPIYLPFINHILYISIIVIAILLMSIIAILLAVPLMRQFNIIFKITKQYANCQFQNEINLSRGKFLYPLYIHIKKMGDSIRQLLTTQKEFSMTVAHELRSPLSRILVSTELLRKNLPKDSLILKHVDDIQEDVNELEILIKELIEYSKFDWQSLVTAFKEIDIIALVEELTHDYARNYPAKKIVAYSSHSTLPLLVHPNLFKHAISNLIGNAAKYSENNVRISIEKNEELLNIKVEDDAQLIAKQDYEKIFQSFIRLQNNQSGFGLGLALVKKITELHKGAIHIEESALGGNCFVLSIHYK